MTEARLEELIRFVIHRHRWPRDRAIALLDSLDERGLWSIRADMRDANAPKRADYSPFARGFEV